MPAVPFYLLYACTLRTQRRQERLTGRREEEGWEALLYLHLSLFAGGLALSYARTRAHCTGVGPHFASFIKISFTAHI